METKIILTAAPRSLRRPTILAIFVLVLGFGLLSACAAKFVPSFASPEQTFATWKYAASNYDLRLLMQTYSKDSQSQMEKELAANTSEGLKAMQDEAKRTGFLVQKVVYENNIAYVRVERSRKKDSEIEILRMIKEPTGWKIVP